MEVMELNWFLFLLSKQVALAPKATCIAFGMGI